MYEQFEGLINFCFANKKYHATCEFDKTWGAKIIVGDPNANYSFTIFYEDIKNYRKFCDEHPDGFLLPDFEEHDSYKEESGYYLTVNYLNGSPEFEFISDDARNKFIGNLKQ